MVSDSIVFPFMVSNDRVTLSQELCSRAVESQRKRAVDGRTGPDTRVDDGTYLNGLPYMDTGHQVSHNNRFLLGSIITPVDEVEKFQLIMIFRAEKHAAKESRRRNEEINGALQRLAATNERNSSYCEA